MAVRNLPKLLTNKTTLFVCDLQEGFRKTIKFYPQILEVAGRLVAGSKALDMPVVFTEQYPKGLGSTVSELDTTDHIVFPKTKFSMFVPEVQQHLKSNHPDVNSVILCGIESHVCVYQTVLDLVEHGFQTHVPADAVSSRSMTDRMFALESIREAGGHVTTSENLLLRLCQDAKHPRFKQIQKIIWDESPDSGLLGYK